MSAKLNDPIVAIATPTGQGAIGVIRISGAASIELLDKFFFGKNLSKVKGHTIHYGKIRDEQGVIIDECLVSIFRAPRSYTKEDAAEISCHGSTYILQQVVSLLIRNGFRQAEAGEFTMRAFLNGQMDLSQAEAVADLIASENKAMHELAMKQLRGGFSDDIKELRQELIDFASLIELELDFGEEDVEFADRNKLKTLVNKILVVIHQLRDSFEYGNAIKSGVPVAIVGRPNVGKSTLLNALLNEDRAIVSEIAGTTRDVIEDNLSIDGIRFRFIDTAGLRATEDRIESMGIDKTKAELSKAKIILFMDELNEDHQAIVDRFNEIKVQDHQKAIIILNKADVFHTCHQYDLEEAVSTLTNRTPCYSMSAKEKTRIEELKQALVKLIQEDAVQDQTVVSNIRHMEALHKSAESLEKVANGLDGSLTPDFIAMDIRQALHHLGEITGEISTDDLLESIFTRFCIGK